MGTTSSAIFNGNSRYSKDFQAVIDRAVAIASMPITQLTNDKTLRTDQSSVLSGLDSKFSALQTAVAGVGKALGGASFQGTISDTSKLGVTIGDGAVEGNYSIDIIDAGAYASSMTSASWVDTGQHTYQLSLGGVSYGFTPSDNSAASVASAINAKYGDKVRASVVNVRTSDNPDYRMALQATQLGDLAPDILDGSTSLQGQQTQGVQSHYIVNGSGQDVFSSSRSVAISTGVTLSLLAKDNGTPVNITLTRSSSALSDALTAFATAYNASVDAVDQQHGTTAGTLAADPLVGDLSQIMRGLATHSSPGSSISSLSDLGLDLDKAGHLSFNAFKLLSTDLTNSSGVIAFLGSATTSGFLKSATDSLNGVEQAGTGLLPSAEASSQSEIARDTSQIADQQARVDAMKQQMTAQMAASDALIASMEQQYNFLSGMFQAMQVAAQQYK